MPVGILCDTYLTSVSTSRFDSAPSTAPVMPQAEPAASSEGSENQDPERVPMSEARQKSVSVDLLSVTHMHDRLHDSL